MRSARSRVIAGTLITVVTALAIALPASTRARTSNESTILSMVASARSQARLPSLVSAPALDAVAKRQSERMRTAGRIFHNPRLADDLNAARLDWSVAGENVGVGPSVADVQRAFMSSPTHRANVLNRTYDAIGTSVTVAPGGRLYITQVFARLVRTPCHRSLMAEDGSRVRPSFYGAAC